MINFLYKAVMKHEIIYSLIYGATHVDWRTTEDQIITIKTKKLEWSKDKKEFYYIWSWPGPPDYNTYTAENYGKTWAFSKEKLVEFWDKNERKKN